MPCSRLWKHVYTPLQLARCALPQLRFFARSFISPRASAIAHRRASLRVRVAWMQEGLRSAARLQVCASLSVSLCVSDSTRNRRHQALHAAKSQSNICQGCKKTFSRLDALNVSHLYDHPTRFAYSFLLSFSDTVSIFSFSIPNLPLTPF